MQDLNTDNSYFTNYSEYKIKSDDVLKIDISTDNIDQLVINQKLSSQFENSNRESLIFAGYQVSSDGTIAFPSLGIIHVKGMTIKEIKDHIHKKLIDKAILINPTVDVKLLNAYFVVLGEANNPGRFEYFRNNLNIFEAISMAGDLTINGKRKDIKLIRDVDGKKIIKTIDLTSSKIFDSDFFQIVSGDILIINPNNSRVKNAGIIGNSGTLISLLSFLLSSVIVMSSVNN